MLVFDPKEDDDAFFYHGIRQRRDITKKQKKDQKFIFERVFNPTATNEDVFLSTTKDIIDTLLEGYNCSGWSQNIEGNRKLLMQFKIVFFLD